MAVVVLTAWDATGTDAATGTATGSEVAVAATCCGTTRASASGRAADRGCTAACAPSAVIAASWGGESMASFAMAGSASVSEKTGGGRCLPALRRRRWCRQGGDESPFWTLRGCPGQPQSAADQHQCQRCDEQAAAPHAPGWRILHADPVAYAHGGGRRNEGFVLSGAGHRCGGRTVTQAMEGGVDPCRVDCLAAVCVGAVRVQPRLQQAVVTLQRGRIGSRG